MRGESHSDKALTTLARMGTTPQQWRLTPIDWVREEREVPGLVRCPTCRGRKFVRIEDGRVVPPPIEPASHAEDFAYGRDARRDAARAGRPHGNCPTCGVAKRGWGVVPQGKIRGTIREEVMVGYPQFPPGTQFDSRFHAGTRCGLCDKVVVKSNRVPVHATGVDGVTHGMLVGRDCASKFLDVKLKIEDGSIMEDARTGARTRRQLEDEIEGDVEGP